MRDRAEIEREMYEAREDLEHNLSELEHAVREKVDIRARARVAVARITQRPQVYVGWLAGAALVGAGLALWHTRGATSP